MRMLSFTMLKKLAVAFLVMLVLSAPQIFMCWTVTYEPTYPSHLIIIEARVQSPNQEVRASGIKVEKTMLGDLPSSTDTIL